MTRSRLSRAFVVALVLLGPFPGTPTFGQVVVDDFSLGQSRVEDPPGEASSAGPDAGILGSRRDLAISRTSGPGTATAEVAAGALTVSAPASTGTSATVVWDGDDDPESLDPVGLGGSDLTTGGASAFRVTISATATTSVLLRVHGDASNRSEGVILVPAGPSRDVFLPFASLRSVAGTGADLANVGALELSLRVTGGDAEVDTLDAVAPQVSASKADFDLGGSDLGTTPVTPGQTFEYRVTITNTGGSAEDTSFTDTLDPSLLPPGSFRTTPLARDDAYTSFGNVTLAVPAGPDGLLANDEDFDGDAVAVSPASGQPTTRGGTVDVSADGGFVYTPPAGFVGVDAFAYELAPVPGDPTADAAGDAVGPAAATATIDLSRVIWFVDDSVPGPGTGTQADPFSSFAPLGGPGGAGDMDEPGDRIYVRTGSGSTDTGGLAGFELEDGQELLGEGVALEVAGQVLIEAGARPVLTNTAGTSGVGLTLAADNTIRGLDVGDTDGLGLTSSAAESVGSLAVSEVSIGGTGGILRVAGGGTLDVTLDEAASAAGATHGFDLLGNGAPLAGTLSVLGTTRVDGSSGTAIVVSGSAAALDFGTTELGSTTPVARGVDVGVSPAGSVTFAGLAVDTDAGFGIRAQDAGLVAFASMAVASDGGPGLAATGTTLHVGGTTSTVAAAGGAALDLESVALDDGIGGGGATFASVSSSSSPGFGVRLRGVTGALVAQGGTLTGATGTTFAIGDATNGSGGSGDVTFAGSIMNSAGRSVEIVERTGGTVTLSGTLDDSGTGLRIAENENGDLGTVILSGSSKVLSTGAATAVSLVHNDDVFVRFTGGGLDIDTTGTATAFVATGGAAGIEVSGPGNTIDTTNAGGTGRAVDLAASSIDAAGILFESVTVDGADTALRLVDTGPGPFEVGGAGANPPNLVDGNLAGTFGTGGSITHTTADAVVADGVASLTLRNLLIGEATTMAGDPPNSDVNIDGDGVDLTDVGAAVFDNVKIADTDGDGIKGTGLGGLRVVNSELLNIGISADGDETGLDFRGDGAVRISGTVHVENTVIDGPQSQAAHFGGTGAADITVVRGQISNERFGATFPDNKADGGIELNPSGGQTMNLTVIDTVCLDMEGPGCYILLAEGASTIHLYATGTRSENLGTRSGFNLTEAFNLVTDAASGGGIRFHIVDNEVINSRGSAARIAAAANGTVAGIVADNDFDGNAVSVRGLEILIDNDGNPDPAHGMIVVDGNTIDGYGDHGIEAQVRDGTAFADFAFVGNVIGAETMVTNEGINVRSTDDASVNLLLDGNTLAGSTDRGMDLDVEDSATVNMTVVGNTVHSPNDDSFNPETEDAGSTIRLNLGVAVRGIGGVPVPVVEGNDVNDNFLLDEDAGTFVFGADDTSDPDIGGVLTAAQVAENGNTTGGGAPTVQIPNGAITVVSPHANWGITATGGAVQSTTVGTAFAPLEVTVLDASGGAVAGATVTFTLLGVPLGPTGTLSSATASTNGSGVASVGLSANSIPGGHRVLAKAGGIPGFALFTLTNAP